MKDKIAALKMMFFKESLVVFNSQKKTGYFNKMCLDEMKRLNDNYCIKIKDNLSQCSENFYEIISDVYFFFIVDS